MISENTENFLIKFFFDLLASIFCRQKFGQIYDDGNDDNDGDNNDNDNTDFKKSSQVKICFFYFFGSKNLR